MKIVYVWEELIVYIANTLTYIYLLQVKQCFTLLIYNSMSFWNRGDAWKLKKSCKSFNLFTCVTKAFL